MLGSVQLELQKLVDSYVSLYLGVIFFISLLLLEHCSLQNVYYDSILSFSQRSHIVLTITNPSESLLNELRTVEVCLCIYLFLSDSFIIYYKAPNGLTGLCSAHFYIRCFPCFPHLVDYTFILMVTGKGSFLSARNGMQLKDNGVLGIMLGNYNALQG